MPIDPNIILGIKPAQLQQQDPLESYGKTLTLQNLMRHGDDADRVNKRRDALQSLLATNPDEAALRSAGFLDESLKVGKEVRERAKLDAETGKLKADTGKTEFDTQIGQIQHGSAILSTAKDQPSWDMARRVMALTFPKIASQLPEQYDPAFVQAKVAAGQTLVQKLADERAGQTIAETGRHNLAGETNAAAQLAETKRSNKFKEENPGLQHIDTSDGIVAFNPRTGTTAPVMGSDNKPLQGGKGLTESQGKATGMAVRAQEAHDILTSLENAGVNNTGIVRSAVGGVAGMTPFMGDKLASGVHATMNTLPGALGGPSSEQQRTDQARRDFVNAALRVESGAAISQSEFENAARQYFPQPGDSAATIEQKRKNRETEIQNLKLQSGPGAKNVVSKPRDAKPAGKDVAQMSDADLKKALGL